MKQLKLKAFYPHLFAIILLILIGFIYFYPTLQGKVVNQSDVSSFVGAAKETIDYRAANNGEEPLWTNSMFSGMPTTMISTYYKGNYLENIYEFLFVGPRPAADLILGFISFYFLMLAFGVNPWLSIVGALAFGLCSYNFQIIQVGHNAKMTAIALMPAVLAALVYAFRKNRWLGAVLFGITLSFEIMANHPQITFYLAFITIFYGIAQLYTAIKQKALPSFLKTTILLIVAAGLAGATNVNHLWPTWEYGKYTMRGGSELTLNQKNQTKGGLDKEYATAWSYGIDESLNLLIPNFKGGASAGALSKNSETYKFLKSAGSPECRSNDQANAFILGSSSIYSRADVHGSYRYFLIRTRINLDKRPHEMVDRGYIPVSPILGLGTSFHGIIKFLL